MKGVSSCGFLVFLIVVLINDFVIEIESHPASRDVDFFVDYYGKECQNLCGECNCKGFYCGDECICECLDDSIDVTCVKDLANRKYAYEVLVQGVNGTQWARDLDNEVLDEEEREEKKTITFGKRRPRDTEAKSQPPVEDPTVGMAKSVPEIEVKKTITFKKLALPPPKQLPAFDFKAKISDIKKEALPLPSLTTTVAPPPPLKPLPPVPTISKDGKGKAALEASIASMRSALQNLEKFELSKLVPSDKWQSLKDSLGSILSKTPIVGAPAPVSADPGPVVQPSDT